MIQIRNIILLIAISFCVKANAQLVEWDWMTSGGGGAGDYGYSISLDKSNYILSIGYFNNTAYFDTIEIYSPGIYGGSFITKIDSTNNFIWVKKAYSTNLTSFYSCTSDYSDNVYVAGGYKGTLYLDSIELVSTGDYDPLIIKYSNSGVLQWVIHSFGTNQGYATNILCDLYDHLYVAGGFEDTINIGAFSLISTGNDDTYLSKFDTLGNCLWLKKICGSSEFDRIYSMNTDAQGNCFITGSFKSTANFIDTTLESYGNSDGFILKTDSSGTIKWIRQFGGSSLDYGLSVNFDNNGYCNLVGIFNDSAIFGDTTITAQNGMNFFIAKLDQNGDFIWVRSMFVISSLLDDNYFNSICSDDEGNSYVTIWFADTFQFDGITLTSAGNYDSFVMKLSPDGEALWAMQLSSPGYVHSRSITNDNNGNLYITGWFNDVMTYGDSTISPYGGADVFIAKLHEEPVSVSYNEITETLEISVYPNPASDYVNIANSEQQIEKAEIIGMNGVVIRTFNKSLNQLDVTGLRNGTYLLKLFDNNTIYVKKIVIN